MKLGIRLPDEPRAAAEARRAVEDLGPLVTRDQLDDLRLLVTELVTNAVRYSGGWVDLKVFVERGFVRVEVTDPGPGFDPGNRPDPGIESMGGRGLYLVEQIADRWGVKTGDRTVVWFELEAA
jgi:anti-sigma regulatory factor (Ser/Thr protein kinase)